MNETKKNDSSLRKMHEKKSKKRNQFDVECQNTNEVSFSFFFFNLFI